MRCPSDEDLAVYLDGGLSDEQRESIRTHAETCVTCRAVVSALVVSFDDDAQPASSVPSSGLPKGTIVGRYTVDERLGAGGMGVVYAARDVALGRRVALKLLRGRATSRRNKSLLEQTVAAQARLQREARMMAKLGHPNVVAVYEVGEVGEETFVAMELVEGVTLRQWLRDQRRSVAAILDAFEQVARGLEAAHAAKIVHRDIKPENVLVGNDGRVRITDFGLAEGVADTTPGEDARHSQIDVETSMRTRVGMLIGTPAYMAPEQLEGLAVDERSDQFSFAVMLWEALYGERPYAGGTPKALLDSMRTRTLRPAVRFGVPGAVRRALRRALEPERSMRFESMAPFVEVLSRTRMRRRELLAAAAVILVASVASTFVFARRTVAPPEPCKQTEDPLALVWDAGARNKLASHVRETAPAIAEEVLARTLPTLDAWGTAYRSLRTSTCEATRIRGEQSEAMLDLRMACLDRRKRELAALVDVLLQGDVGTVARAPRAALALTPLSTCSDASALAGPIAPSSSVRPAVDSVRTELARGEAAWLAGHFAEGLAIAKDAVTHAAATGHRPVEAEALFLRAKLEEASGSYAVARDTLLDAISRAEAGKHDQLAVEIWAALTRLSGGRLDRDEDARMYEARAHAALERAGDPLAGRVALDLAIAAWRRAKGDYASAAKVLEDGLRAMQGHESDMVVMQYELLVELARDRRELGDYDGAQAAVDKGLAVTIARFGPNHPDVASLTETGAMIASRRGDHTAAVEAYRRVVSMRETLLGANHPDVAQAKINLATALTRANRPKEAIPLLDAALAAMLANYGDAHPNIAQTENNLGFAWSRAGDLAAARVHFERAIAIGEKALGAEHPKLATWLGNLAKVETGQGNPKRAIELLNRALAIEEAKLGPKHVDLAFNLTALGEAYLALGKAAAARPPLERAVALREAGNAPKEKLAESRFALARALQKDDPKRAQALALAAEQGYVSAGAAAEKDLAAVRAFLAR